MRKATTNSILAVLVLLGFLGLIATLPLEAQKGGSKGPKDQPPPDPAIAYIDDGWLMVMNADGSNQTPVGKNGRGAQPDWSPDARRLVFAYTPSKRDNNEVGIYLINVDGSGLCKLAPIYSSTTNPAWSPPMADGSEWIVYSDYRPESAQKDLFAVRADCNNPGAPVNLTNTPDVGEWRPSWSRFANRLTAEATGAVRFVVLYDVLPPQNGLLVPQLSYRGTLQELGLFQDRVHGAPSWAKNDDRIVLVGTADPNPYGHSYDLWVTDLTVAGTHQLTFSTEPGGPFFPNWSASGNEIVYELGSSSGLPTFSGTYSVYTLTKQINPANGAETWTSTKLAENGSSPKWRRCDQCR